ncbi:MAG: cytochrome C biogenesis protein [Candidatus Aenigmarchaeota archaeon]|nr:cytochrome C biogenesis protein [Candidatus Aenigmarchaeota archaeon]
MVEFSLVLVFAAGILSFFSPCILPLIPGFIGYLSGISVTELKAGDRKARLRIFLNSLAFVLGFTVVFAAIGVLLNSFLGSAAYDVRIWTARIGGIVIITFGLYLLGLIKIPWLQRDHKIRMTRKFRFSYVTSFVFGAAFAVGWTPCVGAILGGILTLAITQPGIAFYLLIAYAIGLGIPFLIAGAFTGRMSGFIKRSEKFMKYFGVISGILLIIIGIMVFTNTLNIVASFFALNAIGLSF